MQSDNEITPVFYSIGQVSRMLNLPESLLRFWEKEFDVLKPAKTAGGKRKYTQSDIETIRLIYRLVKIEGYTLEGAKEKIKTHDTIKLKTEIAEHLNDLKNFLNKLYQQL
jgi:DNA-binding transcriptional MerR regulator